MRQSRRQRQAAAVRSAPARLACRLRRNSCSTSASAVSCGPACAMRAPGKPSTKACARPAAPTVTARIVAALAALPCPAISNPSVTRIRKTLNSSGGNAALRDTAFGAEQCHDHRNGTGEGEIRQHQPRGRRSPVEGVGLASGKSRRQPAVMTDEGMISPNTISRADQRRAVAVPEHAAWQTFAAAVSAVPFLPHAQIGRHHHRVERALADQPPRLVDELEAANRNASAIAPRAKQQRGHQRVAQAKPSRRGTQRAGGNGERSGRSIALHFSAVMRGHSRSERTALTSLIRASILQMLFRADGLCRVVKPGNDAQAVSVKLLYVLRRLLANGLAVITRRGFRASQSPANRIH